MIKIINPLSIGVQILFWVGILLVSMGNDLEYSSSLQESILHSSVSTCVLMILVYQNVLWSIPKLLYKKRYLAYIISLIISAVVFSCLDFFADLDPDHYDPEYVDAFIIFSFVESILIIGGISSISIIIEQLRTKEKLSIIEKEHIEANLKYLKAQTNPHFLFNVLNNIHFLINKDPDKASHTLLKLSDLVRYQLYETDSDLVPIQKEVKHLRDYIELEQIRMGDNLDLDMKYEVEDGCQLKIQPFLMLPLVENAFKHSRSSSNNSIISIHLSADEKGIELKIKNSLSERNVNNESHGLGLVNLKHRLELLYPKSHHFTFAKGKSRYKVHLIIEVPNDVIP